MDYNSSLRDCKDASVPLAYGKFAESAPEPLGNVVECPSDKWVDLSAGTAEFPSHSKDRKRPSPSNSRRSGSQDGDQDDDQEKKLRREAANSNERRRMMSINNGFLNLQTILPKNFVKQGEKMSKAAVLQITVDYINKLVQDQAELQVRNQELAQKISVTRLDSGGESNDEGVEIETASSGAQDLVTLVDHWKAKYSRERRLRAQAIEEFRRLIMDAMQCCPSGFSKAETYNAALLRRSQSPTPAGDIEFSDTLDATGQGSMYQPETSPTVYVSGTCAVVPVTFPAVEEQTAIVIHIPEVPDDKAPANNKRKLGQSSVAQDKDRKTLKPLTGFDILYQAITFSENLDGNEAEVETTTCVQEIPNVKKRTCKKRRK